MVQLFSEPQYLKELDGQDPDSGLTAIDYEEQTAGYQAAYSRLAASESAAVDPVAFVRDPREYLAQELGRAEKAEPRVKSLVAAANQVVVGPFLQTLGL